MATLLKNYWSGAAVMVLIALAVVAWLALKP